MAKDDKGAAAVAESATDKPVEISVALDEFCSRLSENITAPELIGAFYKCELAAARLADLPSEYQSRYEKFINRTV